MKYFSVIVWVFLTMTISQAQIRVAHIFGDHMVLQRNKEIPVWGWASSKEKVTVKLGGQTKVVQAGSDGKWMIKFAAMPAGGPFQLLISAKSGKITLNDVLIGEVWICSGQSNMEWPVNRADNADNEKQAAAFPQIRHFKVANSLSLTPEADLKEGEWKVCSPETVGDFTAVGYFFARSLYQKLNVPVGLINTSWGGSQVEGWISKDAMLLSDVLKEYATTMPQSWEGANTSLDKQLKRNAFGKENIVLTSEDEKKYLQPDYDFSKWRDGSAPGSWDWQGFWAYRGNGYAEKTITIPASIADQVSTLGFGQNNSPGQVYINGKLIWEGALNGRRKIEIPAHTWKAGKNALLLKFGVTKEPSWFGMGLHGAPEDFYVQTETERINLSGSWKNMPAIADKYEFAHLQNNMGTIIYNAMVHPLIPYAFEGVIWYQGESNAGRAYQYRKTFPLLINDWRQRWGTTFPFLFVQLSSYGTTQSSNQGSNWAELREAQTMTLQLPQTGMVVTTDIGNPADIHPTNKQDVGKRLAASALKIAYQKDIVYSGPLYTSVKYEKGKAILSFQFADNGLMAKDKYGYLKGFEIAGDDNVFYYAKAEIIGNQVVVYHPKDALPVSVRYAWTDAPSEANLFNTEGFPASPFRTDTWISITTNEKFQ